MKRVLTGFCSIVAVALLPIAANAAAGAEMISRFGYRECPPK
jgi:hypothetical protein